MSVPFLLWQRVRVVENTCWRGATRAEVTSSTSWVDKVEKPQVSVPFLYHQSGCLAGWAPPPPTDPSEGRSAARRAQRRWHRGLQMCTQRLRLGNPGFPPLTDLMGLGLGPGLQPGKDAIVALDDPVLFDGQCFQLGGGDGHAETDLQNPTAYERRRSNFQPNRQGEDQERPNILPHGLYWQWLHSVILEPLS